GWALELGGEQGEHVDRRRPAPAGWGQTRRLGHAEAHGRDGPDPDPVRLLPDAARLLGPGRGQEPDERLDDAEPPGKSAQIRAGVGRVVAPMYVHVDDVMRDVEVAAHHGGGEDP